MKEIIINALKLCLITLVAGVLLGTVYEVTKEPRREQAEKMKKEAYQKVFKDASEFEDFSYDAESLASYLKSKGFPASKACINEIVMAKAASGEVLGYVFTVTDKEGYGGEIVFTIGIRKEGSINGISFLTLAETAGVGMKAGEAKFKDQFSGMKAVEIEYVKNGKVNENQIDAISGATVTTNAVTNGVNCAVNAFAFITESDAADTKASLGKEENADE